MNVDRNGLEVLDRNESLRLLETATLGRIAITSNALPMVLPVNFRFDGSQVLFRTAAGTKLDAATDHAVVAFEVDEIDPATETGWSVVVTGMAREVTDPAELDAARRHRLTRWASGDGDRVVSIRADLVSGRRIPPKPYAPAASGS
jgi:nitroimidazol reductase NimA-like FMN-containing flavoprotein (pyridoxamine 5'-phosphate oxidase superfamily)